MHGLKQKTVSSLGSAGNLGRAQAEMMRDSDKNKINSEPMMTLPEDGNTSKDPIFTHQTDIPIQDNTQF